MIYFMKGAVLLFKVLQRRILVAVGKLKTQPQKGQYTNIPVDAINQLAAAIEQLKTGVFAAEVAVTTMAAHCRVSVQIPANAAAPATNAATPATNAAIPATSAAAPATNAATPATSAVKPAANAATPATTP
ncbi:hypothetical protein C8J57DRAFT_1250600 [Mycena rebaudengoi]|nr:hypothetical protein C8J57DRAFT_1250600 [Mycena rebaudengoi]